MLPAQARAPPQATSEHLLVGPFAWSALALVTSMVMGLEGQPFPEELPAPVWAEVRRPSLLPSLTSSTCPSAPLDAGLLPGSVSPPRPLVLGTGLAQSRSSRRISWTHRWVLGTRGKRCRSWITALGPGRAGEGPGGQSREADSGGDPGWGPKMTPRERRGQPQTHCASQGLYSDHSHGGGGVRGQLPPAWPSL